MISCSTGFGTPKIGGVFHDLGNRFDDQIGETARLGVEIDQNQPQKFLCPDRFQPV
ncbi:MAG: hypothetical protein WBO29_10920 [Albidovulum sp.]